MTYGLSYGSYTNATLSAVTTFLSNNKISNSRIVGSIGWNGSAYYVVYIIQ